MKGKEAISAARKREAEATTKAEGLKKELSEQKIAYEKQLKELRSEIGELRGAVLGKAEALAKEEIARILTEKEEERRARGLSDEIVEKLADAKDRLIRNACLFLSKKFGIPPWAALGVTISWMTGAGYAGLKSESQLVDMGLPRDGWAVETWKKVRFAERVGAGTLEEGEAFALETGDDVVHPKYRREWYGGPIMIGGKSRDRWSTGAKAHFE